MNKMDAPLSRSTNLAAVAKRSYVGPLWLSLPVAILGFLSSAFGLFAAFPYAAETTSWAAQGRGQDAVNLVVFPALLVAAWIARRHNSLPAYLVWLGLLIYSAYSYLTYAGFVHFGPLFPVYVATFGLSTYTALWGFLVLDPAGIRAAFGRAPVRPAAAFLVVLSTLFYILDLSIDLTAIATGTPPQGLAEVGLIVDPVHVLDMGLLLPATLIAGISLWRGLPLGYLTAPPILTFLGTMTVAIGAMFVMMATAGVAIVWPMVGVFAVAAALAFALLVRLLLAPRRSNAG